MLKKVWSTGNVDPDQLERLKMLRISLDISEELHIKLEEEVKKQFQKDKSAQKITPNEMNILIQESKKPILKQSNTTNQKVKLKNVKLKKFITLAKEKYLKGNYSEAKDLLNRGNEVEPNNPEIEFLLKKINIKLQNSRKDRILQTDKEVPSILVSDKPIDKRIGVKIKEKVAIPTSEHKRLEAKSAIPVDNLNGASLNPKNIDLENRNIVKETTKEPQNEVVIEQDDKKVKLATSNKPKCISCNGTGKCYWCGGSGECDRCSGMGKYNNNDCSMCNGSGKCNSCSGEGLCMWCRGKGTSKQMNTMFTNI